MTDPQPTPLDVANAETRRVIADRQAEEYGQVLRWAVGKFGPGWLPSCRHFLVGKAEEEARRREGGKVRAAATVYTVRNDAGDRRHFTVGEGGLVAEVSGYEEGFGPMLLEPDMVRTIEVRGQQVHPHRYSLCWAPYELYQPKSAEELAKLRAGREQKKAERAEQKEREENPLFTTWAERLRAEEGQGREPS